MQFPSELGSTTLGDVLGALHREKITGSLELLEACGRKHVIQLDAGVVCEVYSPLGRRLGDVLRQFDATGATSRSIERHALCGQGRLGEALLADGCISQRTLHRALGVQRQERLEALFALGRARLRFNVARLRSSSGNPPLAPAEFLRGRPRARDGRRPAARHFEHAVVRQGQDASAALALLGLDEQASPDAIRSAYRRRAATLHPDRHPDASAAERVGLNQRFAELTAAYRLLVA